MATIGTPERSHARRAHAGLAPQAGRRGPAPRAPVGSRPMSSGRLHLFRSDDRRSAAQRARRLALQATSLARLPRPVAAFWLRAMRRARLHLHDRPGGRGPDDPPPVDAVFIDSSHEYDETVATFRTWEPALAAGGIIAFHDWQDEAYPGVTEAVRDLGLPRGGRGDLFVWGQPAGWGSPG